MPPDFLLELVCGMEPTTADESHIGGMEPMLVIFPTVPSLLDLV